MSQAADADPLDSRFCNRQNSQLVTLEMALVNEPRMARMFADKAGDRTG